MIYVIKSLAKRDKNKPVSLTNAIEVIKIGYTKDENYKKRLSAYSTHNKNYDTLFTISGGTKEDEYNLHQYFKDLLYDSEWFILDPSIEIFFDNNRTIEQVRSRVGYKKEIKKRLNLIFDYKEVSMLMKEFISSEIYDVEGFYKWLREKNIKKFNEDLIEEALSESIPKEFKKEFVRFFDGLPLSNTKRQKYLYKYNFPSEIFKQCVMKKMGVMSFQNSYI